MTESEDRRRGPRTEHMATALLFVASEQFTCRILNLGTGGVLLIPPTRRPPGMFVRLNLSLPAFDELIDLDGVITRAGEERGHYTWSVEFINAPAREIELIRTFIRWAKDNAEALRRPQNKLPSSEAQRQIEKSVTGPAHPAVRTTPAARREGTGPGHPRVGTGPGHPRVGTGPEHPRVGSGSRPGAASYEPIELQRLYRDALEALADDDDED